MKIIIYTDGGCSGNPGRGGWAFLVADAERVNGSVLITEKNGGEAFTTNNRMELTAVIEALKFARGMTEFIEGITIYTDSQYVQKGITEWIHGWKARGWRTASKQPVKNDDLWRVLDEAREGLPVSWKWVKGHAGNALNERCDALVQEAMRTSVCLC